MALETATNGILVAEDYEPYARVLQQFLTEKDQDVTVTPDGRKALETLLTEPKRFSTLRTDYHMPEMDGLELLHTLRDEHMDLLRRLRVLLKSNVLEVDVLRECKRLRDVGVNIECVQSEQEIAVWMSLLRGTEQWRDLVAQF